MGLISRVSSRTYREMYPNQGGAGYPRYMPPQHSNQGQYIPHLQQSNPGYQQPHQPNTSKSNDILNQAMAMGGAMLAGKAMGGKKGKSGSSGMSGMTGMAMNMLSGSKNKNPYGSHGSSSSGGM